MATPFGLQAQRKPLGLQVAESYGKGLQLRGQLKAQEEVGEYRGLMMNRLQQQIEAENDPANIIDKHVSIAAKLSKDLGPAAFTKYLKTSPAAEHLGSIVDLGLKGDYQYFKVDQGVLLINKRDSSDVTFKSNEEMGVPAEAETLAERKSRLAGELTQLPEVIQEREAEELMTLGPEARGEIAAPVTRELEAIRAVERVGKEPGKLVFKEVGEDLVGLDPVTGEEVSRMPNPISATVKAQQEHAKTMATMRDRLGEEVNTVQGAEKARREELGELAEFYREQLLNPLLDYGDRGAAKKAELQDRWDIERAAVKEFWDTRIRGLGGVVKEPELPALTPGTVGLTGDKAVDDILKRFVK